MVKWKSSMDFYKRYCDIRKILDELWYKRKESK